MYYFLAVFLALLPPSQSPAKPSIVIPLVNGVARTFAQMKDFTADFTQIAESPLNRKHQSAGHVYLMRPKMMRWEYKTPEEQLYVSDGKTAYDYVPADRQVNKYLVKEAFDDRMPLMFLLGKSNLLDEFERFALLNTKPVVPGTLVLQMYPKRKTDLSQVIMEADPANYQVRRLLLVHTDGSRSDFIFSNIRTNTGLKAPMFSFKVPPGVEVVDGLGQ